MNDIKLLHKDFGFVEKNLKKRGLSSEEISNICSLSDLRRTLISQVENKRAEINKISKEASKSKEKVEEIRGHVSRIKKEQLSLEKKFHEVEERLHSQWMAVPNFLLEDVPEGTSEEDNQVVFKKGELRTFDFEAQDHINLGEKKGFLDFETASLISGARFVVYKKEFARLERALINFMLDFHSANGYEEVIPPFIVHERSLIGTGQLPKFKEDLFKIEDSDYFLIPTAEVPLTNLKREKIFDEKELPLKYVSYTPCFRSEAGSYGKDTKGLIRLHQFNKVEMVNIVHPEESKAFAQKMVEDVCKILNLLEIPYRGVLLCSSDTGFASQKTIDVEVWLPSQKAYREISSVSNCGDFQARRAFIRFKKSGARQKPIFAHTLNGSGLAVGRTLVAIVENFQNRDGSISIPKALIPYMGGASKI